MPNLSSFGDVVKPSMPCMTIKQQRNSHEWWHKWIMLNIQSTGGIFSQIIEQIICIQQNSETYFLCRPHFNFTGHLQVYCEWLLRVCSSFFKWLILVQKKTDLLAHANRPHLLYEKRWDSMLRLVCCWICLCIDNQYIGNGTIRDPELGAIDYVMISYKDQLTVYVIWGSYTPLQNPCELHNISINYCHHWHERYAKTTQTTSNTWSCD